MFIAIETSRIKEFFKSSESFNLKLIFQIECENEITDLLSLAKEEPKGLELLENCMTSETPEIFKKNILSDVLEYMDKNVNIIEFLDKFEKSLDKIIFISKKLNRIAKIRNISDDFFKEKGEQWGIKQIEDKYAIIFVLYEDLRVVDQENNIIIVFNEKKSNIGTYESNINDLKE